MFWAVRAVCPFLDRSRASPVLGRSRFYATYFCTQHHPLVYKASTLIQGVTNFGFGMVKIWYELKKNENLLLAWSFTFASMFNSAIIWYF